MKKDMYITEKVIDDKLDNIKKICFFTVAISILIMLNIYYILFNNENFGGINIFGIVKFLSLLLLSITVIESYFYYYVKNDKERFIIFLFYLSLLIDACIGKYRIFDFTLDGIVFNIFSFGDIIRAILLLILTLNIKKIEKLIIKNKVLISGSIIIFMISMKLVETLINHHLILKSSNNLSKIILIAYMFTTIFLVALMFMKTIKSSQIIYGVMTFNLIFLMARELAYYLIFLSYNEKGLRIYLLLSGIIAFVALITTFTVELINYINFNKKNRDKLEVFYEVLNENNNVNIAIFEEAQKLIYINSNMVNCLKNISGRDIDDEVNYVEEFKRNYPVYFYNMIKQVEKTCYWKGILPLENGMLLNIKLEKVIINNSNYLIVSCADITSRYELNNQLRFNEKRLRNITENIKELIINVDMNGSIKYVNKAVLDTLGYDEKELINKNYKDVLDTEETISLLIESKKNDGIVLEHEVRHKNSNKSVKLESILSSITTDLGTNIGSIIVSRDISYRTELELLKDKFNEVKEYEKIRNEFFANLSHELRTPINIIYSCLQLLNSAKGNGNDFFVDYYNKYEKVFRQNCFRMLRLVNNLIDLSKIDSGFMKLDIGNYDIIKLVEDITLSVIPYVESKELNIIFDTYEEELEIQCDPDKIERVVLNLLSNAIKFTNMGGNILVSISVNKQWVEISVKDDGIGIPINLKSIIFERFIQNDKSFNRSKEGSGIGLALVKSLVELHEGKVYLKDSSKNGSEFVVLLPNKKYYGEKNLNRNENNKPLVDKISIEFADIYDIY